MAVNAAMDQNLVAVRGPKVAVVLSNCGSEGLLGSGNTDLFYL